MNYHKSLNDKIIIQSKIKPILESLPSKIGIYIFKNNKNEIIYVGKSINIKNRVRSYFSSNQAKNRLIVKNFSKIDYLITKTEEDALIFESSYIKEKQPKYNITLKDDKTYPYIRITNEDYPKVEIVRIKNINIKDDIIFGPYTEVSRLRKILKIIHNIGYIRTCTFNISSESIENKKHKVCLDYHIGKCKAPCEGLISKKEYNDSIKLVKDILLGKSFQIIKELKGKMNLYSKKYMYEKASEYRDLIKSIDSFSQNNKTVVKMFKNQDYISLIREKNFFGVFLVKIRYGKLFSSDFFILNSLNENTDLEVFDHFIKQYYLNNSALPDTIHSNIEYNSLEVLKILSRRNKKIKFIQKQDKEGKKILDMCSRNCRIKIEKKIFNIISRKKISKPIESLKEDLNMDVYPEHIEAFDISHISGEYQVGGMVVYKNGIPLKTEYRKFKIKHGFRNDDYRSISEVVLRRYSRLKDRKAEYPDLILIDGGKGQLSAAKRILDRLGIGFIKVISLAKKLEEVYIVGSRNPINIKKTSPSLFLLRKIRDEVHRFSLHYHRIFRNSKLLSSILTDIPGLGEKRYRSLFQEYGNMDKIITDTPGKISTRTKIPIKICEDILKKLKSLDNFYNIF